jgi:hypothetical protein
MRYLCVAILFIISTTIQAQICIVVEDYTPTIVGGKKILEICPGVTVKMKAVDCANPTSPISSTPTWTLPGNEPLLPGYNDVSTSTPGIYIVNTSNGFFDEIEIKHIVTEDIILSGSFYNNGFYQICTDVNLTVNNANSFSNFSWVLNEIDTLSRDKLINISRSNIENFAGETEEKSIFVYAKHNATGCIVNKSFLMFSIPLPVVELGPDTSYCKDSPDKILLKNQDPNYGLPTNHQPDTWLILPYTTTKFSFAHPVVINYPGVYILEAISKINNKCIIRDTINIVEKIAPKLDPIPAQVICKTSSVTLKSTIEGVTNTSDYDFKWRLTGKGLIENNSQAILTDTPENDNAEYIVRVTDIVGCYAEERVNVSWYTNQVKATVEFADTSACGTTPVTLGAEGSSGYEPYTYKWFPTTNMTGSTTANPSVTPISQDTITYSVVVSDDKGCKDTAYVTVVTPDMRISIQEGDVLNTCKNDPITLNSVIEGGQAPYDIKWLKGTDVLQDSLNQMGLESQLPFALPSGVTTHKVRVEVLDVRGCPGEDEITINVLSAPSLYYQGVNMPLKICAGSPIKFPTPTITGGSGNSIFTWTGSNLSDNSATPTYTPNATDIGLKTFKVKITDMEIDCPGNEETITVDVIPSPQVYFAISDTTICLGTDAILTPIVSKTGLTYTWENEDGQILDDSSSYVTQERGIYKVKVTDPDAGCSSAEATKTVFTIKPGSYAYILSDTLFPNDIPLILTSLNDGVNPEYTWEHTGQGQFEDNGYAEAIYKPSQTDSGFVTFVLNVNTKCAINTLTDTFKVFFTKKERPIENLLYVPNAFAPSDLNPKNQSLMIFSQNLSEDNFQFMVFNRWGEIVFETTDAKIASEKGWNGSVNNTGAMLKTDVYTYTVKGEFIDGKTFEKSGTATLLR